MYHLVIWIYNEIAKLFAWTTHTAKKKKIPFSKVGLPTLSRYVIQSVFSRIKHRPSRVVHLNIGAIKIVTVHCVFSSCVIHPTLVIVSPELKARYLGITMKCMDCALCTHSVAKAKNRYFCSFPISSTQWALRTDMTECIRMLVFKSLLTKKQVLE